MATFNTRIQLKYDTLTNFTTNNPVLLSGEMALVNIPADSSTGMNEPALMMKIGDGKTAFNSLPWSSALAADVIPSLKGNNPTLAATSITGLADYISGQIQDTDTQYQIVQNGNMGFKLQSKPKGGEEWTDVDTITLTAPTYSLLSGDTNGTVKFGVTGSETEVAVTGLKSAAYTESSAYDAAGSAAAVQGNLDDYETSNDAVIAGIKNGTTINSFGQVESALTQNLQDAKDYTDTEITNLNIGQYATTDALNSAISGVQTTLIGTAEDASSLNTINAAKKYADEKILEQISAVYKPAGSVAFASLPTPAENLQGNVYNITDDFTADTNFVTSEQDKDYPAGTNVVCIEESTDVWRWDVLAGSISLDAYSTTEEMNQAISTSASSTLQSAKDYTNSAINGLDVAITNVTTGNKVASIQQTDGKISVTTTAIVAGDIPELPTSKITGLDTTLSGINSDITALEGLVGETAVATQITNAINALDVSDTAVAGQFLTQVTQTDGKIAVTRSSVDIAQLTQAGGETIIFNCGNSVL